MKQTPSTLLSAPAGRRAALRVPSRGDRTAVSRISLPPEAWLAAVIDSSTDAIVGKTLEGVVMSWNPGAERLFGYAAAEMVGRHISILAAPGRENEMPMILHRVRDGLPVEHYDTVRRRRDGSLVDISLTVSPVRDASGTIIGASKIARDIGERKAWEKKQALLLVELSHRVKNSLAVIQAMARQTGQRSGQRSGGITDFLQRFEGRLQAMAAAHNLLVAAEWRGAPLDDLGRAVLGHGFAGYGGQIHLALPAARIGPSLAMNLALAFHELATNATTFGALSVPTGHVTLSGRLDDSGTLLVAWEEVGGPPVRPPDHHGFGAMLLERVVAERGSGRVRLDWLPAGLVCRMALPLGETA